MSRTAGMSYGHSANNSMDTKPNHATANQGAAVDVSPGPLLAFFDNEYLAVFNSLEYDATKARNAVLRKYGQRGWREVLKRKRTGIMEVFQHEPTKETRLFVREVAVSADARAAKRKANTKLTDAQRSV